MDIHEIFGAASVLLQFTCLVPYFIGIFQKRIKPHGFTWMLWALLSGITFAVQLHQHAGAGAWLSAINMTVDACIAILAFRYGTFTIARSDWMVLVLALMAIPLWLLTANPLWSVLIVCGINILASWPTFRKSWYRPQDEFTLTFFLGGIAAFLSIAALHYMAITTWLYPTVIGVSNMALVTLILYRRRMVNN